MKHYLILITNKISEWVDKHLGYYLTNPANRWRWEERQKNKEL